MCEINKAMTPEVANYDRTKRLAVRCGPLRFRSRGVVGVVGLRGLFTRDCQRQVVARCVIWARRIGAVGLPVTFGRPVVVPLATVSAPESPARDATAFDLVGSDRGRVQVDAGYGVDGDFHVPPISFS